MRLLPKTLAIFFLGALVALPAEAVEPRRIVTLIPSLGELAAALLGKDDTRIVGVVEYTDFPAELATRAKLGTYAKPNLEAIVALKPDLVLASEDGNPPSLLERLRKLGIPVTVVGTDTLAKVRDSIDGVGAAVGRPAAARELKARIDRAIAETRARAERRGGARAHPRTLLQVGDEPLVVVGAGGFLDEALAILGAKNVYGDSKQPFPKVSIEDVLQRDPEEILLVALGSDLKPFERAKRRWESYPKLAARRAGRIRILRSDALVRPGPRFPQGLHDLEAALFEGAD